MEVKVLEICHVAPPSGSLPPFSTIPFSFFDVLVSVFAPVQRLFFYTLPCSTSTFLSSHLPNLKHSLSLTLHRFYPLSGNIITPPDGSPPSFCYSEGDSVSLVVAESDDDFDELTANHPKEAARFHALVPLLPFDEGKQPLLLVQVTVFPNRGVGIGVCVHHGAADGSASTHFTKTWASLCRLGPDAETEAPIFDRVLIPDPKELRLLFWKQLDELGVKSRMQKWVLGAQPDIVRATFVLTRAQIDGLRGRLMAKSSKRYSSFTLACALTWVYLTRARRAQDGSNDEDGLGFAFVHNCRTRIYPPVPAEYFGNCVGLCGVFAKRGELASDDGVAEASERIWGAIGDLEGGGALRDADRWMSTLYSNGTDLKTGNLLTVAGSPNMRVYDVDFGWGRARKVEVISTERNRAMSLAENGDEGDGGIEVGMVLPKDVMEKFSVLIGKALQGLTRDGCEDGDGGPQ